MFVKKSILSIQIFLIAHFTVGAYGVLKKAFDSGRVTEYNNSNKRAKPLNGYPANKQYNM